MLKSIEMSEFQAHEKLVVNFKDGVNVIVGPSFIGKSCIRRAIEWCYFGINFDGIRREGSKKTIVKITDTDGTIVERIRSASINRYVLNHNGEQKVFDSIGKTVPQEIRDAIGINPIEVDGEELWLNSAPQIALPFLFDKSPTWRMKLFNKLTGNDLLDKLFVQFNKDILRIGRDHKSDTERLEDLTVQLNEKEIEKEQLEAIHDTVKNQIEALRIKQEKYDNLLELLELQQNNDKQTIALKAQKTDVKYPQDVEIKELTTKTDDLDQKEELLRAVLSNEREISRVSVELTKNVVPALDSDDLQGKIDRLNMLETVIKQQDNATDRDKLISIKIADLNFELQEDKNKLDELLENTDSCPLCNQTMTEECKKQLKGN